LLPNHTLRGGKGKPRLSPEVETIIATTENFYDIEQKNSIAATIEEIRRLCSNANCRCRQSIRFEPASAKPMAANG
jgi:putative transposase